MHNLTVVSGCEWHANVRISGSHLVGSNMPSFMVDSYEEGHDPPRLHLLDKFDSAGAGACLNRYSDPSYFRTVTCSESAKVEIAHSEMKVQRKKKQRSRKKNRLVHHSMDTTHERSMVSSLQFASLFADELSFSVEDAPMSDAISKSEITIENYFNPYKRSRGSGMHDTHCISKELHDIMSASETETKLFDDSICIKCDDTSARKEETKQRDDSISIQNNEVHGIDYLQQDPLYQESVPSSSFVIWDEKIEILKPANKVPCNDITGDRFKIPIPAEICSALSNLNCGTNDLGMRGDNVSRSSSILRESAADDLVAQVESVSSSNFTAWKENLTDILETLDRHVSCTSPATFYGKGKGLDLDNPESLDTILLDWSPGPDSLLLTTEASNTQHETMTKTLDQDDLLPFVTEVAMSSSTGGQFIELLDGMEGYMDATNPIEFKRQEDVDSQGGKGEVLKPYSSYHEMECGSKKIEVVAPSCLDDINIEIPSESCTLLNNHPKVFDHLQSTKSVEHMGINKASELSAMNDSIGINKARSIQHMVIDGILAENTVSQYPFDVTSSKIASEKEVYFENKTKQEARLTSDVNYQEIEPQSSMKEEIIASNLDGFGLGPFSSLDGCASQRSSDVIYSDSVQDMPSSALCSESALSRSHIGSFSPVNNTEGSTGNTSTLLNPVPENLLLSTDAATTLKTPADILPKSSINIWTNGGLLGLEPSKPRDICFFDAYRGNDEQYNRSAANSKSVVSCNRSVSGKLYPETDRLNRVLCFPEKDDDSTIPCKQHCQSSIKAPLLYKLNKSPILCTTGIPLDIRENKEKEYNNISSGDDFSSNIVPSSTESNQKNSGISVDFLSSTKRYLISGPQRKLCIPSSSELVRSDVQRLHGNTNYSSHKEWPEEKIFSTSLPKLDTKENTDHGFSAKLVSSCVNSSGHSSPLLEHMKISFQPMDDLNDQRVKLDFCKVHLPENLADLVFPSFQLVKESLSENIWESDDDTFCRSCPYSSDDLLSFNSESDAEMWGEDGKDGSDRTADIGSISSCTEPHQSYHYSVRAKDGGTESSYNMVDIIDLPNLDSLVISKCQLKNHYRSSSGHTNLLSSLPNEQLLPTSLQPTKSENKVPCEAKICSSLEILTSENSAHRLLEKVEADLHCHDDC
ncbi:SCAR-like protein 2 [Apostasia shenzhenica]|uniref:Protein SCAR n=1 Tax=Apostasia shenzhenica TaxID=1088818 RepID=A0A2I0BFI4_9ASPA|nr:SCAR-like protein 2 [Apostasia shenzhenica]